MSIIRYTATFADGTVWRRGTKTKAYTHAWRVSFTDRGGTHRSPGGFSSSEQLARAAASTAVGSYAKWGGTGITSEIVPAVRA